MDQLTFSFLGPPEVRHNGRLVSLPTRKALALLAFVILEGGTQPRERLMAMLWPDSDQGRAQSSLRTTLAYIHKALPGAPLDISRNTVTLRPRPGMLLDVDELMVAARAVSRLPLHQSVEIPTLAAAAGVIRGDFLSGFSLPDSVIFDDWTTTQRELYHQQAERVFATLSKLQLESGQYHQGLETVVRWIAFAPLEEAAYHRQMQLYLGLGDRIAALQTFKTVSLMLSAEFGLSPGPEIKALADQAQRFADAVRHPLDAEGECIALNRMATAAAQSYDNETALNLLRQALHLANHLPNPVHRAETQWNLAHTYFYMGRLEPAQRHADEAVALARHIGRDELLGRALNTVAYVRLWSGNSVAEVDNVLDEALAVFRRLRRPNLEVDCLTIRANVRLAHGYPDLGMAAAEEALRLSDAIESDWGYAASAYNLGLAYLAAGDSDRAADACLNGLVRARTAGHPPLVFFNTLVLGHVRRESGDWDTALALHNEALAISLPLASPALRLLILSELCADHCAAGLWAQAAHYGEEARSIRRRIPYSGFARGHEIGALLRGGDPVAATEELAALKEEAAAFPTNRLLTTFIAQAEADWAAYYQ